MGDYQMMSSPQDLNHANASEVDLAGMSQSRSSSRQRQPASMAVMTSAAIRKRHPPCCGYTILDL
jgi:hypothetical protein